MTIQKAKFSIGDVVKHKHFDFRGVIYDVDFEFNNSEEWYESIPKNVRPRKDQPFYHLLAENDDITYEAYVSEQNLIKDYSGDPIKHPMLNEIFSGKKGSTYFKPSNWFSHFLTTIISKLRQIVPIYMILLIKDVNVSLKIISLNILDQFIFNLKKNNIIIFYAF